MNGAKSVASVDFSMYSSGATSMFFLCLQKDGHLTLFCYLSLKSQTSSRMCSFFHISLEQAWLAVSSEGAGSACLGILLVLPSFCPAGKDC